MVDVIKYSIEESVTVIFENVFCVEFLAILAIKTDEIRSVFGIAGLTVENKS